MFPGVALVFWAYSAEHDKPTLKELCEYSMT